MPKFNERLKGWELIANVTGKNRDFFEYNNLKRFLYEEPENFGILMQQYKRVYPIAQNRLYLMGKSDIATTRQYQQWVLNAKPAPSKIADESELVNALYDTVHMLTSQSFSVGGFHQREDRAIKKLYENYGIEFDSKSKRADYRDFIRFLDKFSSVVGGKITYNVNYAFNVWSELNTGLSESKKDITASAVFERFIQYKQDEKRKRLKLDSSERVSLNLSMYRVKDMISGFSGVSVKKRKYQKQKK